MRETFIARQFFAARYVEIVIIYLQGNGILV